MNFHRLKKALYSGAFFIAIILTISTQAFATPRTNPTCSAFKPSETATIRYIHDGDTLFLKDKRKVRLIGIDTPELARKKNNKVYAEQAFATEARDFARQLIQRFGNKVRLMPGKEATDRYQRHLFHVQLSDGSLLQSRLIEAGLAVAYTTPPNQQLASCYQQSESLARRQQLKIWSDKKYQVIHTSSMSPSLKGFHLIKGKVRHIGESKKAYWLNFHGNFSVRIDKRDIKYFHYPLSQLHNKEITVRGWLRHYKNKAQLSVRHPSAIKQD